MTPEHPSAPADRRTFLKTLGAATLALGTPLNTFTQRSPVRFGLDLYSLQSQNWTPFQYMDLAAKWNVQMVHFSEIRFLGATTPQDPENLKRVRSRADEFFRNTPAWEFARFLALCDRGQPTPAAAAAPDPALTPAAAQPGRRRGSIRWTQAALAKLS